MAWLQVRWGLYVRDPEEADPGESAAHDEPSLQFALVTAFDGIVRLHGFSTGNLFPHNPGLGGGDPRYPDKSGTVSSKNVPTDRHPFFGLVVRATEEDNSQDRDKDNDNFFSSIKLAAQTAFDSGEVPDAATLWSAGNSVPLKDTWWRDDDDKLGVSARSYPFYGSDSWPHLPDESSLGSGGVQIVETRQWYRFAFVSKRTARYELRGNIVIVTNDPPTPRLIGDRIER